MTLAVDLDGRTSVDGWLASEKLNGCRAYWTGKEFFTRGGDIIAAPKWFTKGLPDVHLDGEINCGRDGRHGTKSFEVARVAVQHGGKWFEEVSPISCSPLTFSVFDAPQVVGTWSERMKEARLAVQKAACAVAVQFRPVRMVWPSQLRKGEITLADYMLRLAKLGSEGAMFRNPDAVGYAAGRSENLLRLKFERN